MKYRIACAVVLVASSFCAAAQETPGGAGSAQAKSKRPEPCSAVAHRQFDFWLGRWNVADARGEPAGINEITLEQGGCVLIERWRSKNGETGLSINYYDPRLHQWRQHWVSPNLVLEMAGGLKDGSMILEGPLQYLATKRVTILRGIWTQLPDGRVRQRFIESADDGKTWTEWFDGYYSKSAR